MITTGAVVGVAACWVVGWVVGGVVAVVSVIGGLVVGGAEVVVDGPVVVGLNAALLDESSENPIGAIASVDATSSAFSSFPRFAGLQAENAIIEMMRYAYILIRNLPCDFNAFLTAKPLSVRCL